MSTAALNTQTKEVENKLPVVSGLVNETDYNAKISGIEQKYSTNFGYNKFTKGIFDAKMKEKGLVDKSDTSNLVKKLKNLNKRLTTLAIKSDLKAEIYKKKKIKSRAR